MEGGDAITPLRRKTDQREWHTERYLDVGLAIRAHVSRETLVEDRFVVKHRCRTYGRDCGTAVNMRTPSPEPHDRTRVQRTRRPHLAKTLFSEVMLGTYGAPQTN
jgi:hypothetical protein